MLELNEILNESVKRTLAWGFSCYLFHKLSQILSSFLFPNLKSITKSAQISCVNRSTSSFHAVVMTSLVMYYWIFINSAMIIDKHVTPYQSVCLDLMMGYLLYDITFEVFQNGLFQASDTIGHHILGLISHLSTRISNNGGAGFYSMLVFIAEASTPFLHGSWLLHTLNMKKSATFLFFAVSLLIVFFLCRVLLGPFMLYHMLTHQESWGEDTEALFWINFFIVAAFAFLNFFWFYKLIIIASGSTANKKSR